VQRETGEMHARRELEAFYLRYNRRCNEHAFERLEEFVANDVEVNGERQGLRGYVDGLEEVVRAFPDFRWELRHLLIDEPWIAAHLIDHGTNAGTFRGLSATGRAVTTQEFAFYRVAAGKIAEVWGDLRTAELIARLRA
jgi:predicted ester cyclase